MGNAVSRCITVTTVIDGENGTSPWVADLDNEMDGIACDADGHPVSSQDVTTRPSLNYGNEKAEFKITGIKRNGSSTIGTGVTIRIDGNVRTSISTLSASHTISITYDATASINTIDRYDITIANSSGSVVRIIVFTVNAVRPGGDGNPATIYNILTSQSEIHASQEAGIYTSADANLVCGYVKNVGGQSTTVTDVQADFDGLKMYFRLRNRTTRRWSNYLLYRSYKSQLTPLDINTYDRVEIAIGTSITYDGTVYSIVGIQDVETVDVVADGSSPYFADLDNENISVACDASGKTLSAISKVVNVNMWHGSKEMALTTLTAIGPAGITLTPSLANKTVTIAISKGTTIAAANDITVTIACVGSGNKPLHIAVNGIRPGADGTPATIYDLLPGVNVIPLDGAGVPKIDVVYFACRKVVGNGTPVTFSTIKEWKDEGLTLHYVIGDTEYAVDDEQSDDTLVNYHDIEIMYENHDHVTWLVKKNGNTVDYEGIGTIRDGEPGTDGTQYQRMYKSTNSSTFGTWNASTQPTGYPSSEHGWSSTPTSINTSVRYRWLTERRSTDGGVTWSAWSEPVIDGYLSEDGRSISIKGEAVAVVPWGGDLPQDTTSLADGSIYLMNNDDVDDYNTLVSNVWEGATAEMNSGFIVDGHLWVKVANSSSAASPRWQDVGHIQGPKGDNGDNAVVCSLENEHEDFLYTDAFTANGGRVSGVVTSQARLRDGQTDVTERAAWTISSADGVVINSSSSPYYAAVSNISGTKGLLTVNGINKNRAKVTVRAEYPVGSGKYYYAEFTSNRKKQDKYSLVIEPSSIAYNPVTYTTKRISIYADVTKIDGTTSRAAIAKSSAQTLQLWVKYGTTEQQITQYYTNAETFEEFFYFDVLTSIASANDGITFELRKYSGTSYTVEDYETVEIAKAENGSKGKDAERWWLDVQGGISEVAFETDYAGIIAGNPASIQLQIHHLVGNVETIMNTVPSGYTVQYLNDASNWDTITNLARNTGSDLSEGEWDAQYRLSKNDSEINRVIVRSRKIYQRMLIPVGVYEDKEYTRDGNTVPLVLYESTGTYWYLNADSNNIGTPSRPDYIRPGDSSEVWKRASEFDVVLTKMLFAEFARLGSFIVYDRFFISQYGWVIGSDGFEHWADPNYNGNVGYRYFDPTDPMANTLPSQGEYKFRPMKCINAETGEEWMAGGKVHVDVHGDVTMNNVTIQGSLMAYKVIHAHTSVSPTGTPNYGVRIYTAIIESGTLKSMTLNGDIVLICGKALYGSVYNTFTVFFPPASKFPGASVRIVNGTYEDNSYKREAKTSDVILLVEHESPDGEVIYEEEVKEEATSGEAYNNFATTIPFTEIDDAVKYGNRTQLQFNIYRSVTLVSTKDFFQDYSNPDYYCWMVVDVQI